MIDRELAAEIEALAERIARIKPMGHRNPDAFFEERSDVASRMRAIAEWARSGRKPPELDAGTEQAAPIRSRGRCQQIVRGASR